MMLMRNVFLLLMIMAMPVLAFANGQPGQWQLLPDKSSLTFVFLQAGTDETGEFATFTADFAFDPEKLEQGGFEVTVDMGSVKTGDAERDEILLSKDMFAAEKWPRAHFKTLEIKRADKGDDAYLAQAELTIRDKTQRIAFPFRLRIMQQDSQTLFRLQSEITIKRLDFGVGQGDWKDTKWIANEVQVLVDVQAHRINSD